MCKSHAPPNRVKAASHAVSTLHSRNTPPPQFTHTSPISMYHQITTAAEPMDDNASENRSPHQNSDGDPAVWSAFAQNFRQVQSVLDRNRVLIQQVNENHQSKSHDNMVKNVALIQEINGNISKVTSLYSNLSANFSSVCQQRRGDAKTDSGK